MKFFGLWLHQLDSDRKQDQFSAVKLAQIKLHEILDSIAPRPQLVDKSTLTEMVLLL